MRSPFRRSPKDRPEPQLAEPGAAPLREPVPMRTQPRSEDSGAGAALRFLGEARRGGRPAPVLTPRGRLPASSARAAGDGPRRPPRLFRLTRPLLLLFFSGRGPAAA